MIQAKEPICGDAAGTGYVYVVIFLSFPLCSCTTCRRYGGAPPLGDERLDLYIAYGSRACFDMLWA